MKTDEPAEGNLDEAGRKAEPTVDPAELESIADRELIRWSLSLSPEARLDVLQDFVDSFWTPVHG